MKLVRCPNCGFVCKRNGKTNAGSQRWYCNQCWVIGQKVLLLMPMELVKY